jgi:hypothetical protein
VASDPLQDDDAYVQVEVPVVFLAQVLTAGASYTFKLSGWINTDFSDVDDDEDTSLVT